MSLIRRRNSEKDLVQRRERDPFALMQEMLRWSPMRELSFSADMRMVPTFEVKETKKAYVFKADLPGVKEDDVEISLTGNRLIISGQRQEENREEEDRYYAYERSYGSFSRSFTLPEGANEDDVQAELKDGVLTVTVAKKAETKPKRIWLKGLRGKSEQDKSAAE